MAVEAAVADATHLALAATFEQYEPETARAAAEAWVDAAPSPVPRDLPARFEAVETGGRWHWRLVTPDGSPVVESARRFDGEAAAQRAAFAYRQRLHEPPPGWDESG